MNAKELTEAIVRKRANIEARTAVLRGEELELAKYETELAHLNALTGRTDITLPLTLTREQWLDLVKNARYLADSAPGSKYNSFNFFGTLAGMIEKGLREVSS